MVHLRQHPFCEHCKRRGLATLATEVDHIQPISAGGGILDADNLQSLCKPCHSRKTLNEQRG
jgi:5-methylcytosine-specific restriction protein A